MHESTFHRACKSKQVWVGWCQVLSHYKNLLDVYVLMVIMSQIKEVVLKPCHVNTSQGLPQKRHSSERDI